MKKKIIISLFLLIAFPLNLAAQPGFTYIVPEGFQKGMCYVTWSAEGFSSKSSDESLRTLSDTGTSWVQIVVTWYQEKFDSTEIKRLKKRTPTDRSLRHAIRTAHRLGMSVMLKPHIDLISDEGNWRADIGFYTDEDWNTWFTNYKKFITHYAKLAEKEKIEIFCIGTELSYASTRTDAWREIVIPAVRRVYSGKIVYAANWDNYKNIQFWNELDYAGIDAYFPLSTKEDPTVDELKEAWKRWVNEIEQWQSSVKKPVIFTECGYCSAEEAAKRPWEEAFSGRRANPLLQARCYRALFETFCGKPWFAGLYWWKWNTFKGSGGKNHRRFTPQNKPALRYVQLWYSEILS